jgi:predicted ferric reductase
MNTTWTMLRAAGFASFLTLFASVTWGLAATTSLLGRRVSKSAVILVHQFLSTVGLLLLAVHLGGLLVDRFVEFQPLDLLIPGRSMYRPVPVAVGIVAMYATIVVVASSWARKQIGIVWWRRLHLLAVVAFGAALLHGVTSGTDTRHAWAWWTYVGTAAIVLGLLLLRAFGAKPARTAAEPHNGRAQAPISAAVRRPKVAAHSASSNANP